ncbi:phosphocholine cytidylyltransferase family protein [Shewanella sp. SNU WT4]|uniref:phosphocholine cytidylyltransferase family protein n=1 Tax=Shewanella sp. SNU WT4 TaxID=2590015 RepID=UPI00112CEDF1|nr:phosphocholine cytidylyltransferase family protein [Shewanella sp. SNU WT4]QDF66533.1 phosphocholine cytidylyltransferase family protein [Shewanella sp. SNU WT4]
MQGLILAAGRGSRLGELTSSQPKGLTPVLGVSMLERQLQAMKAAGLHEIAAASGYKSDMIARYIPQLFHNPHWQTSNMVTSLLGCREFLQADTSIVSYSDIIYPSRVIGQLAQADGDIVVAYDPNWLQQWQLRFDNPLDDAESFSLNPDGLLQDIGQKASTIEQVQGQFMGLFKLTVAGFALISASLAKLTTTEINKLDMTALLSLLLSQGVNIHVMAIADFWFEIDSAYDLAQCEAFMLTHQVELA